MKNDKKVIAVLTEVILRQKMEAEYQALYASLLLGQIGEDEFEELSEVEAGFAENAVFKEKLDDNDKEKIDILLQYTTVTRNDYLTKYTPSEIGDIFFFNDKIVEEYLEQKNEA